MTSRGRRRIGIAAIVAWIVFATYLGTEQLGVMYSPKLLQDANPGIGPEKFAELLDSPIQRARASMIPVWEQSRYIIPGLLAIAAALTWLWWYWRRAKEAQRTSGEERGAI